VSSWHYSETFLTGCAVINCKTSKHDFGVDRSDNKNRRSWSFRVEFNQI